MGHGSPDGHRCRDRRPASLVLVGSILLVYPSGIQFESVSLPVALDGAARTHGSILSSRPQLLDRVKAMPRSNTLQSETAWSVLCRSSSNSRLRLSVGRS